MNYQIQYREEVDSTNIWAKQLAKEGAPEGTLLLAERQTAGKGRRGRTWISPGGQSIYMSLILRPDIRPQQASMLTLVMGLSVVQACRDMLNLDAWIKWPNDMVVNGKKVCGILTEMSMSGSSIDSVIIGTGINVNQTGFSEEIAGTATSLAIEKGKEIDRKQVLDAVLEVFARNYELFLQTGDLQNLTETYNQVLINKGKEIRVLDPTGEYNGISHGINEKGELLVTKEDGTCEAIYAGEVSVRGVYRYV